MKCWYVVIDLFGVEIEDEWKFFYIYVRDVEEMCGKVFLMCVFWG